MKWFESLEHRRALLITGVVLVCLAALLVTARRFNVTFDVYWHIKTGIDWLTYGLSPWIDHYSYTFHGKGIGGQPYIFQALIGYLVSHFGVETGIEIYRMASFLSVFALVFWFLRKLNSPTAVFLIVMPMLTVLLQQRFVPRPDLISYSLIALAMIFYHRARLRMAPSTMLPVVLLVWVWSNYHAAQLPYVIFFGLFVDTAFRFLRERAGRDQWLQWLGWGLAIIAVGFLKRGFHSPILGIISFSSFSGNWKALILEYVSLPTKMASTSFTYDLGVYALGVLAVVTLVLVASRRYYGLLTVCALLVYFAIDMSRLVTPNGIALLCVFAWMISETDLARFAQDLPRWSALAIGSTAFIVFGICMYSVVWFARGNLELNRTFTTGFPEDVTDYMIESGISGRIFNEYEDGGYLIYRLAPGSRVYIDGRTNILYPTSHAERFLEAKVAPDILAEEIEKYDIDLVLLNNNKRNFSLVQDTGQMKLDYVGFEHFLFRRENPNFPLLGNLLARPACWSDEINPGLRREHEKAIQTLPERSPAMSILEVALAYSAAADKLAFISGVRDDEDWNDYSFRFAGYRALAQGLPDLAMEFFAGIGVPEFADYLAVALSMVEQGDWLAAERALDNVTRVNWPAVKQSELQILYQLLEQIRTNAHLELFDEGYVDGLAQQFEESGGSLSRPNVHSFCPEN